MQEKFSKQLRDELSKAGWHEGRCDEVSYYDFPGMELFPAARVVLSEYAGLNFGKSGPGKECATSDVQIDPSLGAHLTQELDEYYRKHGKRFYVLGEIHRAHGYLLIDESGATYLHSDELLYLAETFEQGLEKLIHGIK